MQLSGIGVGLRRAYAEELLATSRPVDWLEVVPENWAFHGGRTRRTLEACAERWKLVPHSVSLDIGGPDPLDGELLRVLRKFVKDFAPPFYSDHLCWSSAQGSPLHDLLPLPFNEETVEHTAARAREVQDRLEVPLVLENATFYALMPGSTMSEAQFLRAVLERGDLGLLLDVNNVYVNAQNHGFDPRAFIDSLPLERVRQIHVAGHTRQGNVIIDTHIGPVIDEVWSLYEYTLRRCGRLVPTLLEWDQEIPALDVVLDECDRARACAERAL